MKSTRWKCKQKEKDFGRGNPGIEPGTTRTLSEYHTTRLVPHAMSARAELGFINILLQSFEVRNVKTISLVVNVSRLTRSLD